MRAYAEGTPSPVAFFWDDPELLTVDNGDVFELHFNDLIDDWFGISAAMIVEALIVADGRDVLVHMDSPGGMYTEGLAIHSQFKAYTGNVTMRVAGMAASAASVVMLAADRVEITTGSLVMVHDASDYVYGPPAEHRKTADLLDKVSDAMARMYTARAGSTAEAWRALMNEETWYIDQEAVDAGLVDAVVGDTAADDSTAAAARWSSIFASAPNQQAKDRRDPHPTQADVDAAFSVLLKTEPQGAATITPTPVEPAGKPVAAALDWATLQKGLKGLQL